MFAEEFEKIIWRDALTGIDFMTRWDERCRAMRHVLDRFQQCRLGRVEIRHIDVEDRNLERIIRRYDIISVPTILFFFRGEVIWRETGLQSLEHLLKVLDELDNRLRIGQQDGSKRQASSSWT